MLHQFDRTTEIIFKYIKAHPKSDREMICCLDKHSADKLRHIPYSYDNAFQDYAYTCLDYLLELGLIYEIKSEGHIYYAVSAKGNAYKRYTASHYLKVLFPYIVAVLSLITNVIIAIKTN